MKAPPLDRTISTDTITTSTRKPPNSAKMPSSGSGSSGDVSRPPRSPAVQSTPRLKAPSTATTPTSLPRSSTPSSSSLHPNRSPSIRSSAGRKSRSETILPAATTTLPRPPSSVVSSIRDRGERPTSSLSTRSSLRPGPSLHHDLPARTRPATSLGRNPSLRGDPSDHHNPQFFHASSAAQPKFFFANDQQLLDPEPPVRRLKAASVIGGPSTNRSTSPRRPLPQTSNSTGAGSSSRITITPPSTRPGSIIGAPLTPRAPSLKTPGTPLTPSTHPERNHVKFVYANGAQEFLEPRRPGAGPESEGSSGGSFDASSPNSSSLGGRGVGVVTPVSSPGTVINNPLASPGLFAREVGGGGGNGGRRASVSSQRSQHGRAMSLGSTADFRGLAAEILGVQLPPVVGGDGEDEGKEEVVVKERQLTKGEIKMKEMEALAAEARRERKVMDLEISNASLMAINRTLEKQMRKQASALRRYKRLARSGALSSSTGSHAKRRKKKDAEGRESDADDDDEDESMLDSDIGSEDGSSFLGSGDELSSSAASSHATSSASRRSARRKKPPTDPALLSDSDETEHPTSESDSEDEPSSSEDEAGDGGNIEKHRAADEKRLNADLAKHQALLEASVKMNASLKRCQVVTDQLIAEAKKSLEYKVRPSEVRIGGRIISSYSDDEEAGDDDDESAVDPTDADTSATQDNNDDEETEGESTEDELHPDPNAPPPITPRLAAAVVAAATQAPPKPRLKMQMPPVDGGEDMGDMTDDDSDAASAFGEFYTGDQYDTETEDEGSKRGWGSPERSGESEEEEVSEWSESEGSVPPPYPPVRLRLA